MRSQIAQEVCESRPDVGSSRNSSSSGRAANSTPIVSRLRCSTLRPWPGSPITAPAKSSILSIATTRSTCRSFSSRGTLAGWRSSALNSTASRTVMVSRCRSCCFTYPTRCWKEESVGRPLISVSPLKTPVVTLPARTSSKVVLPAPEKPCATHQLDATKWQGQSPLTYHQCS